MSADTLRQALAWQQAGKTDQAVAAYRRVLAEDPGNEMASNNLGQIYLEAGRPRDAEDLIVRALETRPASVPLLVNLGIARQRQLRTGEATAAFEAALAAAPGNVQALNNLAGSLMSQGRADLAMAHYRAALDVPAQDLPALTVLHSNYLMALHYERVLPPDRMAAAHRDWARRYADHAATRRHPNSREPDRRLRIGYVSPDFGFHPVAFFIGAVLAGHARSEFEITCYATGARDDAMTANLRALGHGWRDIARHSDDDAAALIRSDGIDVLVDLAGHTSGNRLLLMARRPAPVQMTYLGYPDTTGLPAIDYRIVDADTDPPGSEALAAESLIRIPGGFLAYRPAADSPAVTPPPSAAAAPFTFGSFNNLAKLSAETVALWSRVLSAVPGSRLLLKSRVLGDELTRNDVASRFAARGVARERLDLRGHTPGRLAHLAEYAGIDVALDPTPYNGTTTTCEALWMGVPVVALAGDRHAARVGSSILSAAGLPELVAPSAENLVAIAAGLAADRSRLAALRATLRQRLSLSPLLDTARLARALEAAYRRAWRRWCAAAG